MFEIPVLPKIIISTPLHKNRSRLLSFAKNVTSSDKDSSDVEVDTCSGKIAKPFEISKITLLSPELKKIIRKRVYLQFLQPAVDITFDYYDWIIPRIVF